MIISHSKFWLTLVIKLNVEIHLFLATSPILAKETGLTLKLQLVMLQDAMARQAEIVKR